MTDTLGEDAIARRMTRWVVLAFLCVLGVAGTASAQGKFDHASAGFGNTKYVVRSGDLLRVRIWGWPEPATQTEGAFPVEESGIAYLPVIGALQVAGKTALDVQDEFRKRFSQEQRNPVVTVQVVFAVSVMGEVRTPGVIDVEPGYSVFDALSVAGGYTEFADRSSVVVVRKGNNIEISGATAAETASKLVATPLESGDRVIVPRGHTTRWQNVASILQVFVSAASLAILIARH